MVNMGNKLQQLRIENKLTQGHVASRVGVAISAISSYESGTRYPSYSVLIKLSSLFHVSTDYLLGLEKNRSIDASGLDDDETSMIAQLVEKLRAGKKT